MAITKKGHLINPEVLGDFIDNKLVDKMIFGNLVDIDYSLQGNPGGILVLPTFNYIGDAEDLAEGVEGETTLLTTVSQSVFIKKAVKNIELTDEAVLCGYGNPLGQAETQLVTSIASKVDNDFLELITNMNEDTDQLVSMDNITPDNIADAIATFGENIDEEIFLIINPKHLATLRKNPDYKSCVGVITGLRGQLHGCNIVVADRMPANMSVLLRKGALLLALKRDTVVETDRNVLKKSTIVSADKHYAVHLQDPNKIIKINLTDLGKSKAKVK